MTEQIEQELATQQRRERRLKKLKLMKKHEKAVLKLHKKLKDDRYWVSKIAKQTGAYPDVVMGIIYEHATAVRRAAGIKNIWDEPLSAL